jgi:hypothetical protein
MSPAAFERQGEAIAFSADGRSYYTIGEGPRARIYQYFLNPPTPPSGRERAN